MKSFILVLLLSAFIILSQAEIVPESVWNIQRKADLDVAAIDGVINYKVAITEEPWQFLTTENRLKDIHTLPATAGYDESRKGVVVAGDCAFKITGDLHDPAPLFVKHGNLEWLIPNTKGVMELHNGQYMDMYCPDYFAKPFENKSLITAQCLQGQYFLVNGTIYPLSNFSCLQWSTFNARRTGRSCNGGTDLLEVGFEVAKGFLQTMDICHDEINEVTRYVHHTLYASTVAHQHSVPRPRFIESDFYAGKNVDILYTKANQNKSLSRILNIDASPYFNYSNDIFMTRGHLAAKSDFILGSAQRTTFLFVNVAPQWHCFNSGNWERVEASVRNYAYDRNLTLECYTGIWGIAQLPDIDGQPKELFLAFDENNNGLIPVPKLYFRVVIEPVTRRGIVLIGVNNPHASLQQIQQEYIICEDIGKHLDWLLWDKENLHKGYSYACSVPDFLRAVKDLPLKDLETSGVLGVNEMGCSVLVNGDLKDQAPLFAKAGEHDWLYPESNGLIELKYGASLDMYCSDSFQPPFHNYTKIAAQCLKGYNYLVDEVVHNFSTFLCKSWPTYTARRTGRSCNGGTDLLEIGFKVDKGFLQTMDICHDEVKEATRYVHHLLKPSSMFYQESVASPGFISGNFYQGADVSSLYTREQQNATFSKILKMDASRYFNESKKMFLVSGHLAAKYDFILASPQRSTFVFVNVAPQWQSFKGGNWQRIEESVRKLVATQNLTVDCYTGTWGIATLPDANGTQQELYLAFDKNNNGLIPVPKLFYRVVIDQESRKGIVLLGVNNPHSSWRQILSEYIICKDVGLEIDWIDWSKNSRREGYSYACSVPDFLKTVKDLPREKLGTLGILGIDELPEEDLD